MKLGARVAEIIRHNLNGSGAGSVSDGVSDDGVADGFHSAVFVFELPPLLQGAHGGDHRAEQDANHHHRNGDFNQGKSPPLILRKAAETNKRGKIHRGHYSAFPPPVVSPCRSQAPLGNASREAPLRPADSPLSSFRNFHPARAESKHPKRRSMRGMKMSGISPTIAGGESDGKANPSESVSAIVRGFRTFSFRQRQLAMPESCAGGMKIPE